MERQFSIEAKSFRFSTKDGSSLFRLEERRKKFVGYIFVSPHCSSWLIDTVEAACLVKENISNSCHEGDKALMVHWGYNKAGTFLEVAVFAEGGRKGGLWLPKGEDGWGWRRFADELRILIPPPPMVVWWRLRFAICRVRSLLRPSSWWPGSLGSVLRFAPSRRF